MKEEKVVNKNVSHVPIKDINKVISDSTSNKVAERKNKTQSLKQPAVTAVKEPEKDINKEVQVQSKSEASKKIKFSDSRKSPVIGSFTPMTFHSTPNKEGIPLTKTMVDQQLHPSRHSDNIKKTIEVHTDSAKQRTTESPSKIKDTTNDDKNNFVSADKDISDCKSSILELGLENKDSTKNDVEAENKKEEIAVEEGKLIIDEIVNDTEEKGETDANKQLNSAEKSEVKSPELNKSSDEKSLETPVTEKETKKSTETPKEVNPMNVVEEVTVPAVETKLSEVIGERKTLPVEETIVSKEEGIEKVDKIVDMDHKKLEIKSTETTKRDAEINQIDNKADNNLKKVVCNEIVVENQSSDEVDNKVCADNIEKKIDQNIKNSIDVIKIQDSTKKAEDKKEELKVTADNASQKSKPQIEEKNETVSPSIETGETVTKHSKVEPIEQKINNQDKIEQQNVTSIKKVVNEKIEDKPAQPQKQNDNTQVAKESKDVSLPKSNLPVSREASKCEPKVQSIVIGNERKEIKLQDIKPVPTQNIPQSKSDAADKKPLPKNVSTTDSKPINNNHAAVPFGKWTEVNRQAFLNKIKESKVPTNSSNGKQIKNSNDLNRRDVLKKIDSQRQSASIASAKAQEMKTESQRQSDINTAKTQDFGSATRMGVKKEAALAKKPQAPEESKLAVKTEAPIVKNNSAPAKNTKQETVVKPQIETVTSSAADVKKEAKQRKEINNQDLIDKTIEEIINRPIPMPAKTPQEVQAQRCYDEIEMKMNELHGKPFIERPIHELPPAQKVAPKTYPKSEYIKPTVSKPSKIPNLLPFNKGQNKDVKENTTELDSEEEVIEHEPITGDMDLDIKKAAKLLGAEKSPVEETITLTSADSKKETIITEKDFDKFVRRNSISYENCLTVNFDGKEPHNVVQSVVQKDVGLKTYSKNSQNKESSQHDVKLLSPRKRELFVPNSQPKTAQNTKFGNTIIEDDGKNYQTKVKMAYQTAMTAKRQMERPITIIEDKPVKVVYMDTNTEFISNQLNVQGKELSPAKKPLPSVVSITTDSQDSDNTLDSIEEEKLIDDTKIKTKHQRKQVLTPVETPELELIEPDDLGIEVSPKKKRKTEEKPEKNTKTLVPKKSYLLGRGNTLEDSPSKSFDFSKTSQRETLSQESSRVSHQNTASAIDSLVKAAELLETQSGNVPTKAPDTPTSDSQQNTPVKRGRGRPRKYPLPEGAPDKTKVPSPKKKPRLIDAKVVKSKDTDDDSSSDDDTMIKENWTMGKINENIVCPICKKLFRSENVVFKHVKHCTGPSPSRSDSENKSPRRYRESQESESRSYESKSDDMEIEESEPSHKDETPKKRKSKDSQQKKVEKDDIIVIEDTPLKAKPEKRDEAKPTEVKKTVNKNKMPEKVSSLVCEFCGKTFRQLSYLVSHKLQHSKEDVKKLDNEPSKTNKSVFSCEVCKKEFRLLHHLVNHRLIHNPSNVSGKISRKSSSEQNDNKVSKEQNTLKPNEDASAGFRCEPCDKSFRKLHHLVEHRETHDGINRQKNTPAVQTNAEKLPPPPQCEICKKTFRKLHHLIEHKEQHLETSSEKSDDKSIKSALSTKDIIHECSLCYMVFPNEHSLNKHTINCERKKRQSASKQLKQTEENETDDGDTETVKMDENKEENVDDDVTIVTDEVVVKEKPEQEVAKEVVEEKIENKMEIEEEAVKETSPPVVLSESLKHKNDTEKKEANKPIEPIKPNPPTTEVAPDLPVKVKKSDDKPLKPKVHEAPRKKTPSKDKVTPTVTKRHKPNVTLPVVEPKEPKPAESSDDDEARYMLNPDYKFEDNEAKLFMKVRANKRSSLQIERPNSKDLVTRRISLQHPLKVPRLKAKAIQNKVAPSNPTTSTKTVIKAPKPEPVPSTDSDDSDVKYSFPKTVPEKLPKSNLPETSTKEPAKKPQRKSLAEKRKSLSSIAKRKSLGKAVGAKHKVKPSPAKQVRKRK